MRSSATRLLTAGVLAAAAPACLAPTAQADDRPNVLMITVDDLDRSETGVASNDFYTPALKSLAAQGVTFAQGHVTSTVCTPSRYSLLTGPYASRSTHEHFLKRYPQDTMAGPDFMVTGEDAILDRPLWFSHHQLAYEASRGWPHYFEPDQLYDLYADPGEPRNLADTEPRALARMKAILSRHL